MHSLLPSALRWHEQMRRWMSAVSIKSPLISCEGVNTSQELLLFCSALTECRKKWTCVAFIVQEVFGNPQEYFMSGTACWTCEVSAKARFMQGMMAQHFHLYNKLCSLSVLPLAYFQHLHSASFCCSGQEDSVVLWDFGNVAAVRQEWVLDSSSAITWWGESGGQRKRAEEMLPAWAQWFCFPCTLDPDQLIVRLRKARYLPCYGGSPGLENPVNCGTSTFVLLVCFSSHI